MCTFETEQALRAFGHDLTLGQVGREIHAAHQVEAEMFGDSVQAITHLPAAEVADWYGESLRSDVVLDRAVVMHFPPDHFIATTYGLLF